jgi:tungstate transport system ATP-binding protein
VTTSLKVEDINKNYGKVKALKSVSFTIEGGKTVVLLGANGAGKSTLLRILAGLEKRDKEQSEENLKLTKNNIFTVYKQRIYRKLAKLRNWRKKKTEIGRIQFNDQQVKEAQLRKISTLVFQKSAMFSRSVYANLAYGLRIRHVPKKEIRQKVTEALESVGLQGFEKRRAKKVSGGEQQRVSLARALLLDPKILLLDEPTANLDPTSVRAIERAIVSRRSSEEIIIMATHNLGQVKRLADFVIFMHEGRIVETGITKDLFDNPKEELTRKFLSGELEF